MSNDEEVMESVRGIFIAECGSALEDAENSLLRLEQNPADAHELTVLFRIAHTFKGSALSVGYQGIGRFSHHLEAVLDAMRQGKRQPDAQLMGALLRAVDLLKDEVERLRVSPNDARLREDHAAFLEELLEPKVTAAPVAVEPPSVASAPPASRDALLSSRELLEATNIHELSSARFLVGTLRSQQSQSNERSNGPLVAGTAADGNNPPPYEHVRLSGLSDKEALEELFVVEELAKCEARRRAGLEGESSFASAALHALRRLPTLSSLGRVCVARWVGYARRLEVVDAAVSHGVPKTMPRGYSCFPRNDTSLLMISADVVRLFADAEDVMASFASTGSLPQRSFKRLRQSGLRSGLCVALGESARAWGFLFLNATERGAFDELPPPSLPHPLVTSEAGGDALA